MEVIMSFKLTEKIGDVQLAFPAQDATHFHAGMTLRQYYAGLALQGLLVSYKLIDMAPMSGEFAGKLAVKYADATIAALNGDDV